MSASLYALRDNDVYPCSCNGDGFVDGANGVHQVTASRMDLSDVRSRVAPECPDESRARLEG